MAQILDYIEQDPGEELWWGLDWNARGWLHDAETISAATWAIADYEVPSADVTLAADDTNIKNSVETWIRLADGTRGKTYLVTCTATASGGEIGVKSLLLRCR